MDTRITATELARSLADILNLVRYRRERFVVERAGEAVAVIEPAGPAGDITLSRFISLWRHVPRPDEAFGNDLEALQAGQPSALSQLSEWPS